MAKKNLKKYDAIIYTGLDAKKFKKYYSKDFGKDLKILKVYEHQGTGATMVLGFKNSMIFKKQYAIIYSSGDYGTYDTLAKANAQFKKMYGDLV